MKKAKSQPVVVFDRVQSILASAQTHAARTVNSTQVVANWLIGREIVEEQQSGAKRAGYGERIVPELAARLKQNGVKGYSELTLRLCRQFYLSYSELPGTQICYALRNKLPTLPGEQQIRYALRRKLPEFQPSPRIGHALRGKSSQTVILVPQVLEAARNLEWQPGQLHLGLSWTHYRALIGVSNLQARSFYEIEATQQNWTARELERQINSLLFERLAKSRDKKGVMKLAQKGQQIQQPADVFKDPMVIEFLGLPESHRLVETRLEEALISNLQKFLLELGKGFAFVARQERLTIDGDHFYVDLVFYHAVLKCYVLIDLKVLKLSHEDIGQMQLFVNYYDRERCTTGDNPTLGLILCTNKNDTVVKYTLAEGQQQIFASRYQLHLPTEADLVTEIRRELANLNAPIEKHARAGKKGSK